MAKSQNKNSVKSTKMDLVAAKSNATPKAFTKDTTVKEQVVNARKGANVDKKKAKAKAKMAKASKKKAKK
jgi:hypothetical protein